MTDAYFEQEPPKSTGFEYFDNTWIENNLSVVENQALSAADVQATLAELTARTIATAILRFELKFKDILVCGGGVRNSDLMHRLRRLLLHIEVSDTSDHGLDADWVEAVAFAWLAKRCIERKPGNLPSVTGATNPEVLGAAYQRNS